MKLCTLTLPASGAIADGSLKFGGHANVRLPVPSCVMMNVIVCPAVALVTELEVTFPVRVIAKLFDTPALNTGVAENVTAASPGWSAGTIARAVTGPLPPAVGPKNPVFAG